MIDRTADPLWISIYASLEKQSAVLDEKFDMHKQLTDVEEEHMQGDHSSEFHGDCSYCRAVKLTNEEHANREPELPGMPIPREDYPWSRDGHATWLPLKEKLDDGGMIPYEQDSLMRSLSAEVTKYEEFLKWNLYKVPVTEDPSHKANAATVIGNGTTFTDEETMIEVNRSVEENWPKGLQREKFLKPSEPAPKPPSEGPPMPAIDNDWVSEEEEADEEKPF